MKNQKNILIYNVGYKTLYIAKLVRIIFDKVDGYIRAKKNKIDYDGTKHLGLFHSDEKTNRIFQRMRYLITLKSNISDVYSHKYTKVTVNLDDDLPLEKNIHNVVILIKSVFNENSNHYYYHGVLEKCPYE